MAYHDQLLQIPALELPWSPCVWQFLTAGRFKRTSYQAAENLFRNTIAKVRTNLQQACNVHEIFLSLAGSAVRVGSSMAVTGS